MKIFLTITICCLLFFSCKNEKAKENPSITMPDSSERLRTNVPVNSYSPVDVSPMDMSYFPVDYPKLKTNATVEPPSARVIYSRPHLQGRKLFGEILKYGEPWRLGANESTELDLYKNATIQGKEVKAGRYVIYCIPEKYKWTIVLNSNIDSWGLHPDPSKDIARFAIQVRTSQESLEYLTIVFRNAGPGAEFLMAWDNVEASLPINF